jgi:hypothetical protein
MASQKEVMDFITSNYKHERINEQIVKLEVPLSSGRKQTVYAAVTEGELQVTSPVAWQNKVQADEVLEKSKSMFGIVSINGAYGLKHNAFIADIDQSEIENAFIVLAVQADELEELLGFDDEF